MSLRSVVRRGSLELQQVLIDQGREARFQECTGSTYIEARLIVVEHAVLIEIHWKFASEEGWRAHDFNDTCAYFKVFARYIDETVHKLIDTYATPAGAADAVGNLRNLIENKTHAF